MTRQEIEDWIITLQGRRYCMTRDIEDIDSEIESLEAELESMPEEYDEEEDEF